MASEKTDERRARVRTLWIHSDRQIAEILIDEAYGGAKLRTAEGRRRQLESMRRLVWNDRRWWKKTWRDQKRLTSQDASETRGEYLAVLDSYRDVGRDILTDPRMKGTPRVQALVALTRLEEARAKATGVGELEPPEDDDSDKAKPAVIGVVLGLRNVSPEMREQLRAQGVNIEDDDETE